MNNQKSNSINTPKKLINLVLCLSVVSVGVTISSEIFAQTTYPRYGLFQPYTKTRYPYRQQKDENIESALRNNPKFKNFFNALEKAGMLDELKKSCPQAGACFTIFAPNNDAFNNANESVFEKYYKPKTSDKVLKYHLVKGIITEEEVESASKITMQGSPIKITKTSSQGVYKLGNANAKYPPIRTGNGVIIEIDKLITPPGVK